MCNLYSVTTNQAAIRDLFRVTKDSAGNLPPMPAIFPDGVAPVVRVLATINFDHQLCIGTNEIDFHRSSSVK